MIHPESPEYTDPTVLAIKAVYDSSLENDKAMLKLVQALIAKVDALEVQVSLLMDLHRLEEHKDN